MEVSTGLQRTMKTKVAVMVGVGSTIGTGLFLSSGDVLATAGPGGAVRARRESSLLNRWHYRISDDILSRRAFGADAGCGSLQAYSTEFISPAMGFTIGWVNWIGAATITAQIVASAIIMRDLIPGTPTWIWIVFFSVLLFGVNFANAKTFGNISFWVSSLKIILAVVFVVVGIAMMCGLVGDEAVGFSNYTAHGGAFPMGAAGIGAVILTSFLCLCGN